MKLSPLGKIVVYAVLLLFVCVTVLPLLWVVNLSFKTSVEIIAGDVFALPEAPTVKNYLTAWNKGNVGRYFMNSIIVSVIPSALSLLFGVPLAYAISRLHWKIKDYVFTLIIMGIMLPIHATLIPVFIMFSKLGMLNTYGALIITYTSSAIPLTVYIVRNFIMSVPMEMEEAAFIDGCGIVRAFTYIIVPSIKQSLIVVTILNFLAFWNEYVMAVVLINNPKMYTLPVGMAFFQNMFTADFGAIAACTVISVLPVLLFYLVYNEVLEKGIVLGAMK